MRIIRRKPIDAAAVAEQIDIPVRGISLDADDGAGSQSEVDSAVKTIALLVYNTVNSYWMSASDFENTVKDRFSLVEAAFLKSAELRFTISHQSLMVNGVLGDMDNRYIRFLTEHISKMEVVNFTITRGMSIEEFNKLIGLLGKSQVQVAQLGGFAGAVASMGFRNVETRKIVLKEITEDEMVVAKDQVDTEAIERKQQAESAVLTFLSDETAATTGESVANLHEVSKEPKKTAEVIIKAADSRTSATPDAGKEDRGKVIARLLERFFDGLMLHPSSRSRTGKKTLEKTLEELKKELLAALHAGPDDDISRAVGEVVGRMAEGLRIAGVAVDYSKKLKALEESEKRILRFIKAQGLEKLKQAEVEEQLGESGLDVSGWERLLAKSSVAGEGMEESGGVESADFGESEASIAGIAALLARLEGDIGRTKNDPESASAERIAGDLKEASTKVAALVEGTERKIKTLVDAVAADMERIEVLEKAEKEAGGVPRLSRKKLITILAEIVQEICQPIAVIKCSIEMLQSVRLGQVTPAQKGMLDLAFQGVERIDVLAKNLAKISGLPTGLEPDKKITDGFYIQK